MFLQACWLAEGDSALKRIPESAREALPVAGWVELQAILHAVGVALGFVA